jgi:hypothetical protein
MSLKGPNGYFYKKGTCMHYILFLLAMIFSAYAAANPTDCPEISQIDYIQTYQRLAKAPTQTMPMRLAWLSKQFLSSPYELFVLGDGSQDPIDQCPIYRLDAFDCETFVTTVLALALSENQAGFEQCLRAIRYHSGNVGFVTRNHFTSIDWNRGNQRHGRLKDITQTLVDAQHRSVFKWSKTWIDKAGWFNHASTDRVRLLQPDQTTKMKHLEMLKQQTHDIPKVLAKLPYIPLTALFDDQGSPNLALFNQIPDAAIIEIVRPNWALKDKIGTNLDVSHLGFAFRYDNQLWFRNASSQFKRVVDEPLVTYLAKMRTSPTIKGINIQVVVPSKPAQRCSML